LVKDFIRRLCVVSWMMVLFIAIMGLMDGGEVTEVAHGVFIAYLTLIAFQYLTLGTCDPRRLINGKS